MCLFNLGVLVITLLVVYAGGAWQQERQNCAAGTDGPAMADVGKGNPKKGLFRVRVLIDPGIAAIDGKQDCAAITDGPAVFDVGKRDSI